MGANLAVSGLALAVICIRRIGTSAFNEIEVLDVIETSPAYLRTFAGLLQDHQPQLVVATASADMLRQLGRLEGVAFQAGRRIASVERTELIDSFRCIASPPQEVMSVSAAGMAIGARLTGRSWHQHGRTEERAIALLCADYAAQNAL
jgi:hypothetical protein